MYYFYIFPSQAMSVADSPNSFQDRLDSVNRETDELLRRNASTRDELSGPQTYEDVLHSAMNGVREPPIPPTSMSGASHRDPSDYHPQLPVRGVSGGGSFAHTDLIRREVRAALAAEMQSHHQLVREMVAREWDSRMGDIDSLLKSRFRELRAASDTMNRGVLEVSDQLSQVEDTLGGRLAAIEAELSRRVGDHRREVMELSRNLNTQIKQLGDTIIDAKIDADSQERRASELHAKGDETLRRHLHTLDTKRRELENSVEEMLRADRQQQRDDIDRVRRHANGYEERILGLEHSFHRMQRVVEDAAVDSTTVKSQLRVTRGDVNQLEVLVRTLKSQGGAAVPTQSAPLPDRVHDDIFALKESVAYLAETLERQRHMPPTPATNRYNVPVDSEEGINSRLARSDLD